MYRFLRNSHLLMGLFLAPFVLMFGLSSIRFSHSTWFPVTPAETTMSVAVDPAKATTPRALGNLLMEQEGYYGFILDIEERDGGFGFLIGRMGTIHEIDYKAGAAEVTVVKRVTPFMGMMNWMHGTFGFDQEFKPNNFWALLMLLTSIGLIALGGTGVYLWFKIHQERRTGSILLFASLAFGMGMIALLRFS